MFRQFKNSTPEKNAPELPSWADGFIYWVKQEHLMFGSNRKQPNYKRPVLSIKKHANHFMVLPLTSKASADLYHLTGIEWIKEESQRDSYISYRYENIEINTKYKAGAIPHSERINIMNWLKNHY